MPNPERSRNVDTPDVNRKPDAKPADVAAGASDSQTQATLYVAKVKQAYKALAQTVLGQLKFTTEQQNSVISQFDSWKPSQSLTSTPGFQNHLQSIAAGPMSRPQGTGVLDPNAKLKLGYTLPRGLSLKFDIRPSKKPKEGAFKLGASYSFFDGAGKLGLKLNPKAGGVVIEQSAAIRIKGKDKKTSHTLAAKLKLQKGRKKPKAAEVSYAYNFNGGNVGAFAIVEPGDKKPAIKVFLNLTLRIP